MFGDDDYDLDGRIYGEEIHPGDVIFLYVEGSEVPARLSADMSILLMTTAFKSIAGTIERGDAQRATLALANGDRWIIEPNTKRGYRSGLEGVDVGENWIVWKAAL